MHVGHYGQRWTEGVLSEHLDSRTWMSDGTTMVHVKGRDYMVLCSELVMVRTEDGNITGRCGLPVSPSGYACEGHVEEIEEWQSSHS